MILCVNQFSVAKNLLFLTVMSKSGIQTLTLALHKHWYLCGATAYLGNRLVWNGYSHFTERSWGVVNHLLVCVPSWMIQSNRAAVRLAIRKFPPCLLCACPWYKRCIWGMARVCNTVVNWQSLKQIPCWFSVCHASVIPPYAIHWVVLCPQLGVEQKLSAAEVKDYSVQPFACAC